jgi:hypothetical protein
MILERPWVREREAWPSSPRGLDSADGGGGQGSHLLIEFLERVVVQHDDRLRTDQPGVPLAALQALPGLPLRVPLGEMPFEIVHAQQ